MKIKINFYVSMLGAALLQGCAVHQSGSHRVMTLETGNDVLDAASYVAAGVYLAGKENQSAKPSSANDPQVQALDAAFVRAKDNKLSQRRQRPNAISE